MSCCVCAEEKGRGDGGGVRESVCESEREERARASEKETLG